MSYISDFINRLESLPIENSVYLKRNFNKSFLDIQNLQSVGTLMSFYKVLPKEIEKNKEYIWFFIACLYCYQDNRGKKTLQNIVKEINDENINMKFNNILKERLDIDSLMLYKIGQLVRMLNQKGYMVSVTDLLEDLLHWNSDSGYIQKKWAKEVYSKSIKIIENKGDEENE